MTSDQLEYINRVIMTGFVVRDPEFRHTTTGVPVSNFRIASTKRFNDGQGEIREEICYVGVAAWHELAEGCRRLLVKGSAVKIEGELKSRVRESGDGVRRSFVEIRASRIRFYQSGGEHVDLEDTTDRRSEHAASLDMTVLPAGTDPVRREEFKQVNATDSEEL